MTKLSGGEVSKRTWKHDGTKRSAWGFSLRADGKQLRRQGFASRAEAQTALEEFKAELRNPEPARKAAPVLTLAAAFTRYFDVKGRKKTLAEDQRIGEHLKASFGADTPLADITGGRISEYRASRLKVTRGDHPLSAAAVNRPLQLLRHLLRLAHTEWDALPDVPRIRLEKEPQGRIRWLEPDEENRLLAACAASPNKALLPLVTVALETGMRRGEILGLAWDRIDMSQGVIRLELTKSGKRRVVPMRQAVYNVLAGLPGAHEGRVWPAGRPRKAFESAVVNAKLDAPFRFHDTRHHFASWYVMRGGSLPALQQILGHQTFTMTLRYSHLSPKHLRDEMARTEAQPQRTTQEIILANASTQ